MSIKNIEDLKSGDWINLKVKAEQIWENDHPAIRQVGVLTDETGIVKFVSWEKANQPLLREGAIYEIGKVPVTEYDGRLQVAIVATTTIAPAEDTLTGTQTEIPTI